MTVEIISIKAKEAPNRIVQPDDLIASVDNGGINGYGITPGQIARAGSMFKVENKSTAKTFVPFDGDIMYTMGFGGGPFIGGTGKPAGYYDDDSVLGYGTKFKPSTGITDGTVGWERDYNGAINLSWYNLKSFDTSSTARDANDAALAEITALGRGERIEASVGWYYFNSTWTIDRQIFFTGLGNGVQNTNPPTVRFFFPKDTDGMEVQHFNLATPNDASFSVIENLEVTAEAKGITGTGIKQFSNKTLLRSVQVDGFKEDGILIDSSVTGSPNSNSWRIEGCRSILNDGNGLKIDGSDSNAGYCLGIDCSANGLWGIYDSSFLGNTYVESHAASNGTKKVISGASQANPCVITTSTSHTMSTGDEVFIENVTGMVELNSLFYTITKITDTTFSLDGIDSSAFTAYVSGGDVYKGGAYRVDSANARNLLLGCYSESGQPPSYIITPTTVIGGLHGAGFVEFASGHSIIDGIFSNNFKMTNPLGDYGVEFGMGGVNGTDTALYFKSNDEPFKYELKYIGDGIWYFVHGNLLTRAPIGFTAQGQVSGIGAGLSLFPRGTIIGSQVDYIRDFNGNGSPLGVEPAGRGSTFRRKDGGAGTSFYVQEAGSVLITNATQANPVVITATAHGFTNGHKIRIVDVAGMTELNGGVYTVANGLVNTFELSGIDGTGFTAYTSGGKTWGSSGWVAK